MISVVEDVDQVSVKWVNTVQTWKVFYNLSEAFSKRLLGEFHLSHVEFTDS